jgi:hypothetical protein
MERIMEPKIDVLELDPKKMVKIRCNIEHAQIVLREDAYPSLIREDEVATLPETYAYVIKNNQKKIRYGFELVPEKKRPAAPIMNGFASINDVNQTDEPEHDDVEITNNQITEEEEAALLKQKRSDTAKKAAATRKLNAENSEDKKKA